MQAKDAYQIAKNLWAMEQSRRAVNIIDQLKNEKYQRTFTDELFYESHIIDWRAYQRRGDYD